MKTESLKKAIKLSKPKYEKMSKAGLQHIKNNYDFQDFQDNWVKLMDDIVEKHGSWENRKNHKRWHFMEVA